MNYRHESKPISSRSAVSAGAVLQRRNIGMSIDVVVRAIPAIAVAAIIINGQGGNAGCSSTRRARWR
jgi:hypothetical protein